jgi:disulfide bond formation protein DsbB
MLELKQFLSSPSRVAATLGLVCCALVGASFYVQHVLGIEPCPLCIIQRFTYLALVPVLLGAALLRPGGSGQRGLLWAATALTAAGLAVAGYQTYLQLFPPSVAASCSASLSYMLDTMAVTDVLARVLHAAGDCSDTSFKVLGLTLAQASLLIFLGFATLLAGILMRPTNRSQQRGPVGI